MRIPIKLLLVENNISDQAMIRRLLGKTRFLEFVVDTTEYLSSSLMLLTHPRNGQYDVVFLDLNLEDSRGIDTVVAVYRVIPDIPIVVLSGTEDIKIAAMARECGATDFIVKKDPLETPERDIVEELERKAWFAIQQKKQQIQTRNLTRLSLEKSGAPDIDPALIQTSREAVLNIEEGLADIRDYLRTHYPEAWEALGDIYRDKIIISIKELRLQFRVEEVGRRRSKSDPAAFAQAATKAVTSSSRDNKRVGPSMTLEEAERDLLEALSISPLEHHE